jgi:hypothetical protein
VGVDGDSVLVVKLTNLNNQKRNLTPPSLENPQRVGAWPSSNKNNNTKTHKPNNPKASSFQDPKHSQTTNYKWVHFKFQTN